MADSPTATVNRTAFICFSSRSYNTDRFPRKKKRLFFFVFCGRSFSPLLQYHVNGSIQMCKPVQWWGGGKMHPATARAAIWQFWEHHPWIAELSSLSLELEPYSNSKHSLPCLPTPLIPLPSASPSLLMKKPAEEELLNTRSLARSLAPTILPCVYFLSSGFCTKQLVWLWLGLMPWVASLRRLGVQIQPPPAELLICVFYLGSQCVPIRFPICFRPPPPPKFPMCCSP